MAERPTEGELKLAYSEGVEATDPVIEWLWTQQEVIGEH
jgi:hypothetical protein